MNVFYCSRSLAAFGNVAGVGIRSSPVLTRRCPTSQLSLPISSPGFRPVLRNVARANTSTLNRTVLFFQKPPSSGGGGFFGRFFGGGGGGGGGSGGGPNGGGGDDGGGNFFMRLIAMYMDAQSRWPIRTKAVLTSALTIIGDVVAQRIASRVSHPDKKFELDARRTASFGAWALFFMGPVLHHWFGALDRIYYGRFSVIQKVATDQILFAAPFNAAIIAGVGTLEGDKDVLGRLRNTLWPTLCANWVLWPATQLINFSIVPRQFQMIYVNTVALGWSVALAYITHADHEKPIALTAAEGEKEM